VATAGIRRSPLRGLAWLVWRQNRVALLTGLLVVLAVGAWMLHERSAMVAYIQAHHLVGCGYFEPARCMNFGTQQAVSDFRAEWVTRLRYGGLVILFLPAAVGAFIGAPMFSGELEMGTHQMVLTQSVSRGRWFTYRLGAPGVAVLLGTAALSGAYYLWWSPAANLLSNLSWYDSYAGDMYGLTPVAYAMFALTLGAFVGLLAKRVLHSIVLTLVTLGALMLAVDQLRLPLFGLIPGTVSVPRDHLSDTMWSLATNNYARTNPPTDSHGLALTDPVRVLSYDRFWQYQAVEGTLILLLAAACTGAAVWWLRKRVD
jgi:hypothetical protein